MDTYKKLKIECATDLISMQDWVTRSIAANLDHDSPINQTDNEQNNDELYKLNLLKQLSLFQDIELQNLKQLTAAASLLHFKKGELIIREGEMPNIFFIVASGRVKISKTSPTGKEFTIAVRHEGETFGQIPIIEGIPHFAAVKALDNTIVLSFSRETFLAFLSQNPIIGSRVIDMEIKRIGELYDKLIDVISYTTAQRMSKLLYALCVKYGDALNFTHQELSEMAGTTTETASRVLVHLKNSGIINLTRGKIVVTDAKRLKALGEKLN
jgi:CRP/FNR family transcriptional regulator